MRVLITGGAGFIGSHLAEAYLKQDHEVYVLDNLSTGDMKNIEPLVSQSNFHLFKDTILSYEKVLELVGTCDVVLHLAAAVGVKYIIDHPLESLETNTRGTEIMVQL